MSFVSSLGLLAACSVSSSAASKLDTPEYIIAYRFRGEGAVVPAPDQMARRISERYGIPITENYEQLGSFWTECTDEQIAAMAGDSDIVAITSNNEITFAQAAETRPAPTPFFNGSFRGSKWALDRLDQSRWQKTLTDPFTATVSASEGTSITTDNTAADIDVYVIDYGLQPGNTDLPGRVVVPSGFSTQFENYHHGTQVASIIGGRTVGVATGARMHSIAISSGNTVNLNALMNAMNWVGRNGTPGKSVINLSLDTWNGQRASEWFAVQRLCERNFVVVVAAGNGHQNASTNGLCHPRALVAGGSTFDDNFWLGSKWGPLIDFLAPAEKVCAMASSWQGNSTWRSGEVFPDGTSYAAAYVSGIAAQALNNYWRMTRPGVNDAPNRWTCPPGIRRPRMTKAPEWCKEVMWRYAVKNGLKPERIREKVGTPNLMVQVVPYFKLKTVPRA